MNEQIKNWLLEEKEPSIRYRTLTELLDYPTDSKEVITAQEAVANCKNVERIFARRDGRGLFPHKPEYYGNWTTFTHLNILAELGVTNEDSRITPIVDWILTPGEGKMYRSLQGEHFYVLNEKELGSCRQIPFLRTLVRLGYLHEPRVKKMIDLFADMGRFDGGYLCSDRKSKQKGQIPKSCLASTAPALQLYADLPESYRTGKNYDNLINYFTSRNMIYSKVEPGKIIVDLKMATFDGLLSFVLMIAYAMCKLGLGNISEMKDVWDILSKKPQIDGKYILEAANSKKGILMDKPGQPNKWVTFYMMLFEKYRRMA